jgi:hypothetical protein
MKIGYFDKQTGELTIYSVLTDVSRRIGKSTTTIYNLISKGKTKESKQYILFFDVDVYKSGSKRRSSSF